MLVELAYGTDGLVVDLPGATTVVRPTHEPAAGDAAAEVRGALETPLGSRKLSDIVVPGQRVAISICDGTRPQPRATMLRAVLDELEGTVADKDVVVLVATGTHRGNTEVELEAMLGRDLLGRLEVVNHDASDARGLVFLGSAGAGVPVWLNRRWVEADVRVTTGFVEPHFFAGFSGGPKLVAPGLAGMETILALHDAKRIGDPRATWGNVEGNPVHDDVRAIAAATGVDFACDVVLNRDQEVVSCFAGELFRMHRAACRASRTSAMQPLPHRFDVVVTTNAGFPLDQNLYQCVKGMSAAAEIVRPGGLIVLAARCADGFPEHGGYRSLLASESSPAALLAAIGRRGQTTLDQWQVQIQARIQSQARVAVYTEGIGPEDLRRAHLEPVVDVGDFVAAELERVGEGATCCVLPEGPQTIPFVVA